MYFKTREHHVQKDIREDTIRHHKKKKKSKTAKKHAKMSVRS